MKKLGTFAEFHPLCPAFKQSEVSLSGCTRASLQAVVVSQLPKFQKVQTFVAKDKNKANIPFAAQRLTFHDNGKYHRKS